MFRAGPAACRVLSCTWLVISSPFDGRGAEADVKHWDQTAGRENLVGMWN